MNQTFTYLRDHVHEILGDVETLVRLESPSGSVEGLNRCQDVCEKWFSEFGDCRRISSETGDMLHVRVGEDGGSRVLMLAHLDTVYPAGSWKMTWRIAGDHAFGPGAYDMKAGVAQARWALRATRALNRELPGAVDLLLTADEEVGSAASRAKIEELARGATAVLVLEAPHKNGDLKIARKGVGMYTLVVNGKAAHQGLEPENGRNAIVSASQLIQQLMQLQDVAKGTTLGPNVIAGGTVSNVVADEVRLELDLRVWDLDEARRVDAALRQLEPLDGTSYELQGGMDRPPMEPTEASLALFRRAQAVGAQLGLELGAARVGGGSDGNFTSMLAPTLDGFGALGANAHQKDLEYIHIPSLAPRTALLAGMLLGE